MAQLPILPLTEVARLDVAAPSALCLDDEDRLCLVSDDELALCRYDHDGRPRGRVPLFDDAPLPSEPAARKRRKPDLEALARLPGGRLLALGSGSTAARHRGALVTAGATRSIALGPLYEALATRLRALNIEGATVAGDELLLFQRGNGAGAASAVVRLGLAATEAALARGALDGALVRDVTAIDLGELDGCALAFTDATPLGDGRVLFAAAAEGGGSTYDDGAVTGSVLGVLERDGGARVVARLAPSDGTRVKIEGITLASDGARLFAVADPDDPHARAPLYAALFVEVADRLR